MIIKSLFNIFPILFIVLFPTAAAILYFRNSNINRYVPTITISASSDGGKTYDSNLKSIQYQGADIYVKYEVKVKAKGFWWRFFRNVIGFTIEYPEEFELYDYIRVKKEKTKVNKKKETFSLAASDNPQKAEILFKLPKGSVGNNNTLTLSFCSPVQDVYNESVKLNITVPGPRSPVPGPR
ncbi:MAG: hypothetical protein LBF83_01435 [Spirochaetaceae bacterium]|jgi:glycosidase|nr:hypothetical protein [Spirochaetaceae bacterium]